MRTRQEWKNSENKWSVENIEFFIFSGEIGRNNSVYVQVSAGIGVQRKFKFQMNNVLIDSLKQTHINLESLIDGVGNLN